MSTLVNAGQLQEMPNLAKSNPVSREFKGKEVVMTAGRVNEPRNDREAAFGLAEQVNGFGPTAEQMETIEKLETPASKQWTFDGQKDYGRGD